ncbi:hypothetical protein [Serratia fonticola]|uniref:transcriptional antitermination N peptide n=1 Tax=Serratia fonticola TaxID=47917 RepID=UPI00301BE35A
MKNHSYDNTDNRRRNRRQALRETYNREHNVPNIADRPPRPILSLRRKPVEPVHKALNPINFDYRAQITKAANELYAEAVKEKDHGSCCLPEVAKYCADHRQRKNPAESGEVTARA